MPTKGGSLAGRHVSAKGTLPGSPRGRSAGRSWEAGVRWEAHGAALPAPSNLSQITYEGLKLLTLVFSCCCQ